MEIYYNLASTSTSIRMMGAVLSFVGLGLFILIFSERMFHGLSKLILFFGSQILISRKLFSEKYIEENKATHNKLHRYQQITDKEFSLTEKKEWLEKILKISA